MVKQVKSIDNWGEVAPTLLTSHYQRPARFSRLEPIIEEEPQVFESLHKGASVFFPLLLSGFLYIFLYRELLIWKNFACVVGNNINKRKISILGQVR